MHHMRRRPAFHFILVVFLATTTVVKADETDDFIRAQIKYQKIPGLALAVVRNGQLVKTAGYGLANIKLKTPVSPETVFHVGSIGKQFVAAGIILLVQEGRVGLDDPVSKYIQGVPLTWNGITIRHLLTHTSGIIRDVPGWHHLKPRDETEVMTTIFPAPLRFAPGEKWAYSNAGYYLLAEIITKITGRHWTEHVTERIFKPAGMNATYPSNTKKSLPNRARGYGDNDKLIEAYDWVALHPAGGFLSTALDLAKWDAALDTTTIINESSRREMWTPVRLNDGTSHPYGLGWELTPVDGHARVWHSGVVLGAFRSDFWRFTDAGLTVIILMNLDDVDYARLVKGVFDRHRAATTPTGVSRP